MLSLALVALAVAMVVGLWAQHNHYDMTRAAFEVLPRWQREKFAGLEETFYRKYSTISDWYLGARSGAKRKFAEPYQALVKGQSFHYLLDTDIKSNRELVVKGSGILFRNIGRELRRGAYDEAARYMGVLAHGFQDQGTTIHGLEGVEGGSHVSISRLIMPRPDRPYDTAAVYLSEPQPVKVCIQGYRPRLLGASIDEAACNAYERYREQLAFIRGRIIPVIWHKMYGDERKALQLIAEMTNCNTRVVADVLYTAFALADERFDARELKRLQVVRVEELHPIEYRSYACMPYRFTPIIRNHSLTHPDRRPVPLKLRLRERGKTRIRTFTRGMGTGCHWLSRMVFQVPRGVYSTFDVWVGLHAVLGVDGCAEVKVRFAGKTRYASGAVSGRDPARKVTVKGLEKGGRLELTSADRSGDWTNTNNHIVWAEPTIRKA